MKYIYEWALQLPDIAHRRMGRGSDPDGIVLERNAEGFRVRDGGVYVGVVRQEPGTERRRWVWEQHRSVTGATSSRRYRSAREAALALVESFREP